MTKFFKCSNQLPRIIFSVFLYSLIRITINVIKYKFKGTTKFVFCKCVVQIYFKTSQVQYVFTISINVTHKLKNIRHLIRFFIGIFV